MVEFFVSQSMNINYFGPSEEWSTTENNLEAILFTIYINDFSNLIKLDITVFADDTKLYNIRNPGGIEILKKDPQRTKLMSEECLMKSNLQFSVMYSYIGKNNPKNPISYENIIFIFFQLQNLIH